VSRRKKGLGCQGKWSFSSSVSRHGSRDKVWTKGKRKWERPRHTDQLEEAHPGILYRQIILIYLIHTRPDICYAVNALSQFMCEPKHLHIVTVKHILRYASSGGVMLHGFTDSVWMGNTVNQKSISEYCFRIGFENDFLVQQETGLHSPKHCRSRIHCCECC
jgi:hypothetical protein